ncbi:glycerol dehydratase reactivase beta/small subunit family protein [Desulfogranum marinum]|uniref:glycerol dehydratase reactivase beta/small subunit family protein n=1 Tax=Desulfogranum marinum TaxID=453220 RepID=UPI001964D5B8|nr:glycerol dehydratase reactivase beta/small subunit family protein [Desulfogranum marinum]MBM9512624.1 glycerol dehydratase reactivase beta/small subunit family protein [Desulfogranum marinum]
MTTKEQQTFVETMPVVWIYVAPPSADQSLQFIQLGLEEEGIPCAVKHVEGNSAHELAAEAAKASSLGVGVGLVEISKEAALHHRDLPNEKKLIEIKEDIYNSGSLRRLGANSARFVKGTPLMPVVAAEVEYPELSGRSEGESNANQNTHADEIDLKLLIRIVVEVVGKLNSGKADL